VKITSPDVVFGSMSSAACLAAGVAAAWTVHGVVRLPHGFQALLLVAVFAAGWFVATLLLLASLRRAWPLREGTLPLATDSQSVVWKLMGYLYVTHLWPLINASLVPVNLRAMAFGLLGARIGSGVMIGGKILDASLVEIGANTMLGEDSILTAHAVEGDRVDLGRIVVGRNVTVGARSVILPDVRVGDNAIVAVGAVVTKGTRIGAGEVWGGVPARKIGMVKG
jgi:carbonic anhydrase/acetyltransferase-like protein (isoleucine patch superfamily)